MFQITKTEVSKTGAIKFSWKPEQVTEFQKSQIDGEMYMLFHVKHIDFKRVTMYFTKCKQGQYVLYCDRPGENVIRVFPCWSKADPDNTSLIYSQNYKHIDEIVSHNEISRLINDSEYSLIVKDHEYDPNESICPLDNIVHYDFLVHVTTKQFAKRNWVDDVLIDADFRPSKDQCQRKLNFWLALGVIVSAGIVRMLEIVFRAISAILLPFTKLISFFLLVFVGKSFRAVHWNYLFRGSWKDMLGDCLKSSSEFSLSPFFFIITLSNVVISVFAFFTSSSIIDKMFPLGVVIMMVWCIANALKKRRQQQLRSSITSPSDSSAIVVQNAALDYVNGRTKPDPTLVLVSMYQNIKAQVCKKIT
jgi:hypothetical protein